MSDNKYYINVWIRKNAVGLLVIITSIWALIRTYRYKEPVDNDLFGIIIAILAILVTVLIGWNIYTVLDLISRVKSELNNSKNIIDSDLARFKEESNDKINYESNKNLHITFGMLGKAMLENDNIPSALNFLVLAAWQANLNGDIGKDYESYLKIADSCLDILVINKEFKIEKTYRDNCLSNLRKLDAPNIEEMISKLMKLNIYETN